MSKHPRQAHPSLLVTAWQSLPQALVKLDPRHVFRNPVMFVVWGRLRTHHGHLDRLP